jgi:hypothetical protein
MKALSLYINQLLFENKLVGEDQIGTIYTNIFGKEAAAKKTAKKWRSTRYGRNKTCIIRAWFGDTNEEKLNNVKKFLVDGLDINLDDVDINLGFYPQEASGTYTACQIHALTDIKKDIKVNQANVHFEINKGSNTYIVCLGGMVTKKQLTPAALGLGGKAFDSVEDIIKTIENCSKLDDKPEVKAFAVSSLHKIVESISGKKYKTLQELIAHPIFSRDFSKLNFDNIDEKSYSNVLNDFGEIMGSCFILSKLEGKHNVYFPSASNSAMYDYVIDFKDPVRNVNVSAKANGGAAPACTDPAKFILNLAKANNGHLDGLDDKFLKYVVPVLARDYNGVELNNWNAKIALLKIIADVFKDKGANDILKVLSDYQVIIDDKTFSIDLDSIDRLKESGKLVEFLTKINTLCGYGKVSTSRFFSPEKVSAALDGDTHSPVKQGCISQPFQKYAIDYLNKHYADQITKLGHMCFDGVQIYLSKAANRQISIKLVAMPESIYKLNVTGSINNPNVKNTSIEITKH